MGKNMKHTVDEGYTRNLPLWTHIRAAIRGKQGAVELINSENGYFGVVAPMYRVTAENAQTVDQRKRAYFARGRFLNATGRTHDAYVGMIGSSAVDVELPPTLEGLKDDIDGQNSTINDFALEASSETLVTARYGVLVDPPNLQGGTMAQAAEVLPKLVPYNAEQITRHVVINGKLTMVELAETYTERKDDDYETKEQVRRLELIDGVYVSRIYRQGEIYSEDVAIINGSALDYIPFQFIGAENNKPGYDRPVMFDLAHENLGHFQLSCDNLENLHYHGQGMTNVYTDMEKEAFYAMNPQGMDVGAKGVNMLASGDKVEVLQIAATGALPAEMERVEKRMIMLGAQVTQDSTTNQTLGAKEIDANASTSQLKRIANNVSAGLTQCVKWAAEMVGANADEVKIYVNDRFITDNMTAQDVQVMFGMYQAGASTLDELNEVKRKAGYTQKTNEELAEALEMEAVDGQSEEMANMQMQIDNLIEQLNTGGDDAESTTD